MTETRGPVLRRPVAVACVDFLDDLAMAWGTELGRLALEGQEGIGMAA